MVIEHGGKFLFERSYDSVKNEYFYMPFGGGVEFGETTQDAAIRGVKEELSIAVPEPELLGVKESVFSHEGSIGHDIVFVYAANLADHFDPATIIPEIFNGHPLQLAWLTWEEIETTHSPIYPEGLAELLTSRFNHPTSTILAHG